MEIRKLVNTFTGTWSPIQRLAGIIPTYFQNLSTHSQNIHTGNILDQELFPRGKENTLKCHIFLETIIIANIFLIDSHT